MNKKIEDAAMEYFKSKILYSTDTEQYLSFFKAGAEFALNEGIAFCNEGIDFMNNKDTGCVNDEISYAKNRSACQIYKNVKYQLKQLLLKEGN